MRSVRFDRESKYTRHFRRGKSTIAVINPIPSISSLNRTKTRPARSSLAPVIPTHYDDTREAVRVRIAKNRRTDEPSLFLFVSRTNRASPPCSNPEPMRPRPAPDPSFFSQTIERDRSDRASQNALLITESPGLGAEPNVPSF